ncbi:MAG: 50S ribosomal protein L21 [Candidatus Paraimprobicoccus trichonymphae]|uniref:Large ribosomal subunit protein bL21 n=1 Tax=Candidatus Paraimprobicoccus trichonymphae TaxID=3033793 RepID=A0AA48IBI4_9FIRM|nr:MAG: 50S ribosomal protein L21 [Candidatus Paraimprobicoccus trichonymphae]
MIVKFAIIEAGGKQYKVQKNDYIYTEKLDHEQNSDIECKVLSYCDVEGNVFLVGKPYLDSVKVLAKVIKSGKQKKLTVFTYKPKKHRKRKIGHRKRYTQLRVENILKI